MYQATVVKKIKSETRRNHGLKGVNIAPDRWEIKSQKYLHNNRLAVDFINKNDGDSGTVLSKYQRGEVLYIAEPLYVLHNQVVNRNMAMGKITPLDIPHLYKYDMTESQLIAAKDLLKQGLWKVVSPMFMPQIYGRKFIKVTDIWCERVNEITRGGIIREGVEENHTTTSDHLLRIMYSTLYDKINGVGSWSRNEYVFGYRYDYLPDYSRRLANA